MTATLTPTSVASRLSVPQPDIRVDELWPLTVEQYHAMIDAGILGPDDPVELLEGFLVKKMTKSPLHCSVARLTRRALESVVPAGWFVDSQDPVTTSSSEPEPDASVFRGEIADYVNRHPSPSDTGLLVEIADTSLRRDRGTKKRIYARERIPYYWIVNLVERTVEVYSDPSGPADAPDYRARAVYRPGDEIPVILDGVEVGKIAVVDLFPIQTG